MLEFRKKKKIQKILYSPIVLLILAIIFVILIRSLWGVYKKERLSTNNLLREQIELAKLSSREQNLASSLDDLKTELGIENEIRNKFRVVKEGEQVAVIIGDNVSSVKKVASTTHSFWYMIFHWF